MIGGDRAKFMLLSMTTPAKSMKAARRAAVVNSGPAGPQPVARGLNIAKSKCIIITVMLRLLGLLGIV